MRTLNDHLNEAKEWIRLTRGNPMQDTGWRPTMAVLLGRVAELGAMAEDRANLEVMLYDTLQERDRYRVALEKLACLGNEPFHGNSIGNCIAIDSLKH